MGQISFYLCASLSALSGIGGIIWYAKASKNPDNQPNLIVIILWGIIAFLITTSYKSIVQDWVKAAPSIVALVGNIYIIIVLIRSRNYIFLKWDILIVLIGALIAVGLLMFMNVKDLHVLLQVVNTLSYVPLILRIADGRGREPLGPWALMTLGTDLAILTVLHNYQGVWGLVQPVRALICQSIVIVFIVYKKKKAT